MDTNFCAAALSSFGFAAQRPAQRVVIRADVRPHLLSRH